MQHAALSAPSLTGQQLSQVAYGVACSEVYTPDALSTSSGAAAMESTRSAAAASEGTSTATDSTNGDVEALVAALVARAGVPGVLGSCVAADFASLAWSLGVLGQVPPRAWLDAFCE